MNGERPGSPREARMTPDAEGSVTGWLGDLKAGDTDAAQRLWERYFGSLVRLAHARLRTASRAAEDEEDAALSAFDSFCAAAADGRFSKLDDRDDLWRILVTLTNRKALNQVERHQAQKRGSGRVVDAAALGGSDDRRGFLDGLEGSEPSPEFALMVADEFRQRLDALRDDSLRQIALMRMEGYTNDQIAERLDCGLRSITRKLELIRRCWLGEDD
jgi:DNA-directed RNA polymerase specialized sigma24 family protein